MLQSNGSNHKVLFQNAEGSINMGFLFDDPRNRLADKHWMQLLGMLIESSIENNSKLNHAMLNFIGKVNAIFISKIQFR